MEAVFQISLKSILEDLPVFKAIAVWNLFVILIFSKKRYIKLLWKKEDRLILQCIFQEK